MAATGAGESTTSPIKSASITPTLNATEPHSFDPDTQVQMADRSTKPIKDVKEGDEVVATDPETGRTTTRVVERQYVNLDSDLVDIILAGMDGIDVVRTTQHHPFWSETRQTWVDAANLQSAEQVHTLDGTTMTVLDVQVVDASHVMYDLTVADVHTYYVLAGTSPVLVHNCNDELGESNNGVVENRRPEELPFEQLAAEFEGVSPMAAGSPEFEQAVSQGGNFLWTVGVEGNLNIVPNRPGIYHSIASGGAPIIGGGEITIGAGTRAATRFNNRTGHYRPGCAQCAASFMTAGVDAFRRAGIRVPLSVQTNLFGR
ncbi:polymorphic toxin-type HINT domain-containing protein [Dactylosporangium sp. NPDC050688]|uniref:polymorphic toxin-type HINT domain-containing protein n=1 Tax=Dactylosporangium sp. NPDC050688 TaxID=3157217 RepID=UPI0033C5168C